MITISNIEPYIKESIESLRVNPLRSTLSIMGVIFGVASVVAMLGIGLGAQKEVESLISSLGTQNIHVTANELSDDDWRQVILFTYGLSERDKQVIKELYPNIESASVSKWTSSDVNQPLNKPKLDIYGLDYNYPKVITTRLVAGRFFSNFEESLAMPVCLLGEDLANLWFSESGKKSAAINALNKEIRINRAWFRVIGVLAKIDTSKSQKDEHRQGTFEENSSSASSTNTSTASASVQSAQSGQKDKSLEIKTLNLDESVLVPMNTAVTRLGPKPILSNIERIVLKLPSNHDPIEVKNNIIKILDTLHRRAKVVTVTAADEIIEQKKATAQLFTFFLLTIALISLIVGGIGIANVMLASMVERITEVGLRRALGAKRIDIISQFLAESIFICILGGIIGGLIGIFASLGVGLITTWTVVIPWWGFIVAVLISTAVGVTAGLFPAIKASQISPIEALQRRA